MAERIRAGGARATAAARGDAGTAWVQRIAAVLGVLYLAAMAFGWFTLARSADQGIRVEFAASAAGARLTIVDVAPNGPGDRAGLRVGDAILAVDGLPVHDEFAAIRALASRPAGGQTMFLVQRGGADDEPGPLEAVTVRGSQSRLATPS